MRTNPAWVDEKPIACCKRCGDEIYAGEEFWMEGPFCEACGVELLASTGYGEEDLTKIIMHELDGKLYYEENGKFYDWEEI